MSRDNFEKSLAITYKWEGGYSDHPADPGGKTMYGITHARYDEWRKKYGKPLQSVKKITRDEAAQIYKEEYWDVVNADSLFPGVDLATFDAGVNSGPGRAKKWLVASLDKSNDHVQTVKNICGKRLSFVQSLKIWKVFGNGWGRRIADIQANGVTWAAAAMKLDIKDVLHKEAEKAKKVANNQTGGAIATGGGAVTVDQVAGMPDWLNYGIGFAAFAVVTYLAIRIVLNRQQAKAYKAVSSS